LKWQWVAICGSPIFFIEYTDAQLKLQNNRPLFKGAKSVVLGQVNKFTKLDYLSRDHKLQKSILGSACVCPCAPAISLP